jgi:hypothetical protein
MGVIYPSRRLRSKHTKPSKRWSRIRGIAVVIILLVVANLIVAGYYSKRTYPQTTVGGQAMGNVAFGDIGTRAGQLTILPKQLTLAHADKKVTVTPADLGLRIDAGRTERSLAASRNPVPILNLILKHRLAAPVALDEVKLQQFGDSSLTVFHEAPANAKVVLTGKTFSVQKGKDGYDLSISQLKGALLGSVDNGKTTVTAPVRYKTPKYSDAQAMADITKIKAATRTQLQFKAATSTIKPTSADIASWYTANDTGYSLDATAIKTYLLQAGIKAGTRPQNLTDAATKAKQAIESQKPLTLTLVPFAETRTFKYCLGLRGVAESNRQILSDTAKLSFADLRGWGLEGQAIFEESRGDETGSCDFTIWLSQAEQMSSFGSICDAEWSCRVGTAVVINFTRWQETSPAWKAYGGTVEDYRHMAINHETGHWFGFDHSACTGTGQPAPVMMQQSIELGGCTFNPWPTGRELAVYRNVIGL